MESGTLALGNLKGEFDLQSTVESGQSYLWRREDGRMYEQTPAYGGEAWYYTVLPGTYADGDPAVLRVRQRGDKLEWESQFDAAETLGHLLRLDDDLPAIFDAIPTDPLVDAAYDAYEGMRLVRDPPFQTLISFICSAQMRVARIHQMQLGLARTFGEKVEFDGRTYHAFPTPEALAGASEAQLRNLNLGYRAPYVQRSAEIVAQGLAHPEDAVGLDYENAREELKTFVGVGDKVADCVLLFSLGYLEAVPLDTWIQSAIADHYPDCDQGNYTNTSRSIRAQFGGEYAGYAQTYVFHYLRTGGPANDE
ncbi:DNA-3-methyladenine glycosylase family protein [Haladaptatus sp. GCM10025707]|uniref:DNA-3-methyladenine glycosylase family protein n=1 Tax=unclassified Haladaptatus TaxID=2622732 RepID=UPI0023E85090|nr:MULTISPECIES: DNA glycosylase [unclassified Haladaptatus]